MFFSDKDDASEDMFADTRMSFGEHIEDLRSHLLRAIYGFLIALCLSVFLTPAVLRLIAAPVEVELNRYYDERVKSVQAKLEKGDPRFEELNKPTEEHIEIRRSDLGRILTTFGVKISNVNSDQDEWVPLATRIHPLDRSILQAAAEREVGRRPGLSTLSPQEAFMAYIKVWLVCGLVLGSPWIFLQIWAFVAAGLYPHEKRLVNVYLPISVALFLAGVVLCEVFVIRKALEALFFFNHWLNLEPDIRFNEWLGFAIMLPVLFGISFQLPMVMMFLNRVGVFSTEVYIKKWRIAVFLIHAFAAIITPIDMFSMESLALTMCGLYGLGILLCRFNPGRQASELEVPETEEMVEV